MDPVGGLNVNVARAIVENRERSECGCESSGLCTTRHSVHASSSCVGAKRSVSPAIGHWLLGVTKGHVSVECCLQPASSGVEWRNIVATEIMKNEALPPPFIDFM